jgi:hypothetical protein
MQTHLIPAWFSPRLPRVGEGFDVSSIRPELMAEGSRTYGVRGAGIECNKYLCVRFRSKIACSPSQGSIHIRGEVFLFIMEFVQGIDIGFCTGHNDVGVASPANHRDAVFL